MKVEIIGIGAVVADTLISLLRYPAEDTKMRAQAIRRSGGGPAATGVAAASRLGCRTAFFGCLSADADGDFLQADFERYGVDTSCILRLAGYRAFTSCIWLNRETGTRTCVFDKGDLPPLRLTESHLRTLTQTRVLLVDGNELEAAVQAAWTVREAGGTVLYDAGGLYDGVERLLELADVLIPSEEFALGLTGETDAQAAARLLIGRFSPRVLVITQGSRGGLLAEGGRLLRYPAYPARVVDSNGAGDVFHGAFAAGLVRGYAPAVCCHYASAVSALKCTGFGARESVPEHRAVIRYLEENGYGIEA